MEAMTTRKCPTRTRSKAQSEVFEVGQPVGAVARSLLNAENKRNVIRRIPALTTARTFGPKSPVAEADIQAFLAKCMSVGQWARYSEEEKFAILESLPSIDRARQERNGLVQSPHQSISGDPPLHQEFCENDKFLKRAIARFRRDLKDGYYEKKWLDKAKQAHHERLEGKFDEYVRQHTEEMFLDEEDDQDDQSDGTDDGSYNGAKSKTGRSRKLQKSS